MDARKRSLALYALCVATLMVAIDATIVIVALPSIVRDLNIAGAASTWMVNAYMLTFSGCLLLSGKLGDLYGARRIFLVGISIFTAASLAAGLADSQGMLVAARAVQGLGGAIVTAVPLSLILSLFPNPAERAWAIGLIGVANAAGAGVGEVLGGLLTKALGWHWIFLINLPVGFAVYVVCFVLVPRGPAMRESRKLDFAGAIVITGALALADYALVGANSAGWLSSQTLLLLALVAALLLLFYFIEARVDDPLMPLQLFRLRNFTVACLLAALWVAGTSGWVLLVTLYLQYVLGYDPFEVGLAFVPGELVVAAFAIGLSARMVRQFGTSRPLLIGLMLSSLGLAWFARASQDGNFVTDVLPGMLLISLGRGMVPGPAFLAAMKDVDARETGVASGVVTTSFMIGGAMGVAVLASLAELRTTMLQRAGVDGIAALNGGYQLGFLVASLIVAAAALIAALLVRPGCLEATSLLAEAGPRDMPVRKEPL